MPDSAALVSRGFMDCFVALHAVELASNDLLSLGKPEGFLERQVQGWSERWRRAKTDDVPALDHVIDWLAGHIPQPLAPTLVHNDFKLDNLMLANDDLGRVEAVLDWEMTTIGDPLADVGLSLCYWTSGLAGGPNLDVPGWYTRDEFIHEYATRTGRDLSRIDWYEVLGIFKLAVILQQIYFRWKVGQTQDERFAVLGEQVRDLVRASRRRGRFLQHETPMQLNSYLTFNGQCEAAFKFYEKCLGGKILMMMTYGDSPLERTDIARLARRKFLHATLVVGESELGGSDAPPERYKKPQGFSVTLNLDDTAEAERIFRTLAENGVIQMPLQETFWARRFGMLVDQFGTPWMINCGR